MLNDVLTINTFYCPSYLVGPLEKLFSNPKEKAVEIAPLRGVPERVLDFSGTEKYIVNFIQSQLSSALIVML